MIVKLLTEHHSEFLSLKGGCTGWSESTLFKMSHCWKSHVAAHFVSTHLDLIHLLIMRTRVKLSFCIKKDVGI